MDATECPVERPSDDETQRFWYSGKAKEHTIKYEIGVDLETGYIGWAAGGVPGRIHDLSLSRYTGLASSGIPAVGDKAYQDPAFVNPFKGKWDSLSDEEKLHNHLINHHRVIVENVYNRVKNFRCTKEPWRHHLKLHFYTFMVIINIANLTNINHPIRKDCIEI